MTKKLSLAAAMNSAAGHVQAASPPPDTDAVSATVAVVARGPVPPSRQGKAPITGHFDPAVRRQFRRLALDLDRTGQDLLAEALNDFFQKHGLARIA
jgi:hypothetical protein